ncbi:aminoglycoside adenylyltransferase domain-containing protein [Inconstantimicrobium mannanitabidum]|uniref:Adenylyltransferase n=1 Tax=Inconstantimicrobium mannanitabidum TaxID=1604901 RepID=A0ACB5RB71_9CLOT|nr:aminoglycoside adenylyltransferase domain-containing protein [Clostridium sp. TW13]GKX66465.1 adenylyltransferase [Clostridium sp. TW13]
MLPVTEILNKIVNSYKDILKDNLVGIYLHGSLAMNCFNPTSSDIDFLVVIKEKLDFKEMRQLVDVLLNLSEVGPKKGFEMSVLLEKDTKNFKYPTHFVLHFSDFHKDRYINQPNYICGGFEDHDLAAHIVILRERGICLYGSPIKDIFQEVPKKYYIEAIKSDIEDSKTEIQNNPIYYILNLCRVLCFLQDGKICSKKEGGEWAIINLPEKFKDVIQGALNNYSDANNVFSVNSKNLVGFADHMLSEIENLHNKEGL